MPSEVAMQRKFVMAEEQTSSENDESQTATQTPPEERGAAGGKDAVLADLAAERKNRKAAEKRAADLEGRLSKIEEESKSEQDKALDQARKEADKAARTEERARANRRILTAEVKAAAGGRLHNPADAVALLDLDDFTVDDDGEVEATAISKALDALLTERPYLAANGQKPPPVDQGPRGSDTKPDVKFDPYDRASSRLLLRHSATDSK